MTDIESIDNTAESLQKFIVYHRRIFRFMSMMCLAIAVVLLILLRSDYTWGAAFAVGAMAQLLRFRFLDVIPIQQMATGNKNVALSQLKCTYIGLLILAFGAVAVYFFFAMNIWAMVAGVFTPKLILIADTYIRPNIFAAEKKESGDV